MRTLLSKEGEESGNRASETDSAHNGPVGGGRGAGTVSVVCVGGATSGRSGGGGLDTRLGHFKGLRLGELTRVLLVVDGEELDGVLLAGRGDKVGELVLAVVPLDLFCQDS